jgi:hypothetical protein
MLKNLIKKILIWQKYFPRWKFNLATGAKLKVPNFMYFAS